MYNEVVNRAEMESMKNIMPFFSFWDFNVIFGKFNNS